MSLIQFPDNLTPQTFLDRYWQSHPLLFSQALPDFSSPLTPDMLAGLACDPNIESRMIEGNEKTGWNIQKEPISEETFSHLGDKDWTFLVQDVDKYMPEVATLLTQFQFLPNWRIDDIMVSYATPGGSVGPHMDQYDVFLLQVSGKRHWQLQTQNIDKNETLRDDSRLRVMQNFESDKSWMLEPGDMLYIPPGVPHYGVGVSEDCMTWSIGLRAPTDQETLSAYTDHLLGSEQTELRYRDQQLVADAHPAKISIDALRRLDEQLQQLFKQDQNERYHFLANWLSEPKPGFHIQPQETPLDMTQFMTQFQQTTILFRHAFGRLYFSFIDNKVSLFGNGKSYEVDPLQYSFVTTITKPAQLHYGFLQDWLEDEKNLSLLCCLFNDGLFQFEAQESLFE